MSRRPVDEQALKLSPIHINENVWYYEEKGGVELLIDTSESGIPSGGILDIRIPYRPLAETISRAWGVVLQARKRKRGE